MFFTLDSRIRISFPGRFEIDHISPKWQDQDYLAIYYDDQAVEDMKKNRVWDFTNPDLTGQLGEPFCGADALELSFLTKAVSNLIRKNINKEAGSDTAPSLVKPRSSLKLRTPGLVDAIEKDLSGPNPLTCSALSLKYGVWATTIAQVVSQDLKGRCEKSAVSMPNRTSRLNNGWTEARGSCATSTAGSGTRFSCHEYCG
ncbi:hypothetical protein BV898_16230 [Hypsibius exemplaris]|uniref:Uncharacterized protein n=1 Tax=Hypsibius exemplaris TaxID=2072580 RepID=A0A9X6ND57_HYPEX|nr:hypothetical protein BV898_16230 [Hypsibius exemplaris]